MLQGTTIKHIKAEFPYSFGNDQEAFVAIVDSIEELINQNPTWPEKLLNKFKLTGQEVSAINDHATLDCGATPDLLDDTGILAAAQLADTYPLPSDFVQGDKFWPFATYENLLVTVILIRMREHQMINGIHHGKY